jgi:large subunit ribosomal protein L10
MNRDQKAVAIAEIAAHIDESHAIFAVDYRGISVPQVAELRAKLRDADATFTVVKNSLTERAADQAGAETLKEFLAGPTALTFVRGDVATAAKAIADYGRATQLLPFKGALMDGATLDVEQIRTLSRLPSREILYGQLVGVIASPVTGLVRTLNALLGGLAVALGQVREKKESGEIPAGAAPSAPAEPAQDAAPEPAGEEATAAGTAAEPAADEPAAAEPVAAKPAAEEATPEEAVREEPAPEEAAPEEAVADEPAVEEAAPEEPVAEEAAEPVAEAAPEPVAEAAQEQTEPDRGPAQENDNEADASTEVAPDTADANPTKED